MTLDHKHRPAESRRDGQTRAESTNTQALGVKLDHLLAKTKPTKRELVQQRFFDLYPKLETHLSKGTPLKDVLAAFNELAHAKVCTRTFNDMLSQERGRRDQDGNPVFCESCGNRLNSAAAHRDGTAIEPIPLIGGTSLDLEH